MNDSPYRFIGKSVPRREDKRLLQGDGTYVADLELPNMVHAAFNRSQLPHARIVSVDLAAARSTPGVAIALSGLDLREEIPQIGGMQVTIPQGWRARLDHRIEIPTQSLLADDRVRYVGEAYAVVVATDRYEAEDAAELVTAEFDPLPVMPDVEAALAADAIVIHDQLGTNLAAEIHFKKGRGAEALADSLHRLKRRLSHHRYAAMPIECRGVVANYDTRSDTLTVWSATQVVHWVRREIALVLGMPEERIRCVAPDVGGGFGVKGHCYTEEVLVAYLARRLRRPVKWIEDRHEHFLNSAHSRDQVHDVEVGYDADGRILAIYDSFVANSGAYSPVGAGSLGNSIAHLPGPYDFPHYETDAKLVITNRTPNAPYRGAGRPEVAFVMERIVDMIAAELDLEPAEVRLRNMVQPEQMPYELGVPYRDGEPIVYDSGNYPKALRRALEELGGLSEFRQRQRAAWDEGRYLGLGIGSYVEGTGVGPFESATIRVDASGMVVVTTGACPQGQGHETVLAQVTADTWRVPIDDVVVTVADTGAISMGYGTVASRIAVTASNAIVQASERLKDKVLTIAAHLLESSEGDLEFRDGGVGVKGVPDLNVSLRQIHLAARPGWDGQRPEGVEPGLEETAHYEPPTVTWTYATNAAIVEVDKEIGRISIEHYVSVHDAGVMINPGIVDGQVKGGLVQGMGGGLLEEIVYDENAQLLTGSFMDYLIPSASEVPPITVVHEETPSPLNPLGVKGLGEGGAIAPPVVIANAVADALKPFRAEFNSTPVRWEDIMRVFSGDDAPALRTAR